MLLWLHKVFSSEVLVWYTKDIEASLRHIFNKDMEELNKTQLILLALLVSFVTSIATGITTVTLLDQAPPEVTQTINRIVRTTEQVIVPSKEPQKVTQTIVVKEEDFIVEAAENNAENVVRVAIPKQKGFSFGSAGSNDPNPEVEFIGIGFALSEKGVIAVNAETVSGREQFFVEIANRELLRAELIPADKGQQGEQEIALLQVLGVAGEQKDVNVEDAEWFSAVDFTDSDTVRIGQTVIALGADENGLSLLIGVVSRLDTESIDQEKLTRVIYTTVETDKRFDGGPLLDINGRVIGITVFREGQPSTFPANEVQEIISAQEARGAANDTDNAQTDGAVGVLEGPEGVGPVRNSTDS